jgi:iron complex transport system substrate-binding protein
MSLGDGFRRVVFASCVLAAAGSAAAAERVVALGGDVTEIVFALDAGDRLVAVDSTSDYPPAAEELPDLGYFRRLAAEPIVALEPDLVLASAASGPPVVLEQLRAADVPVAIVPNAAGVEGVVAKIQAVGRALDREAAAEALVAEVEAEVARARDRVADAARQPRVLFVLNVGRGAPLAGGSGTSAAAIIDLAGGRNAVGGFEGYKPLSPEAAIAAAPDVVLVPDHTLEAAGGPAALLERPELRHTPAAAAGRVVAMDGLLLLGFGPRLGEAVSELARALHPDLVADKR